MARRRALDQVPAMVRKLDGEILFWGRGLEALYGWPVEEAVGWISDELLATKFPVPLPEIEAELLDRGVWQGELVRAHRDGGRVVVASRWALYRRDGGDPVSVLEFDSDITETRRAQAMLKEREACLSPTNTCSTMRSRRVEFSKWAVSMSAFRGTFLVRYARALEFAHIIIYYYLKFAHISIMPRH
jgi:PAS domain S-box-containing protein